jgi:acyl-CoA thioester hydrolase
MSVTFSAMFRHETTLRVRYGETDRMGYVYYGDYAEYLEVGRVEALRSLGFPYRRLEEEGVLLPVRELRITYHRPAYYDDALTVSTTIAELPLVRIVFGYEIRNEAGQLLCEASTTLVFVDRATMRPRRAPSALIEALAAVL